MSKPAESADATEGSDQPGNIYMRLKLICEPKHTYSIWYYDRIMQSDFILITIALVLGFSVLGWLMVSELKKLKKPDDSTLVEWLKSMQRTIELTNRTLNDSMRGSTVEMTRTLQSNTKQLNERLDEAARVIGSLNKHVGEMSEMGKGIKSLQEFLQSPKLRGNIGEQVLKDMIGQSFPKNSFHMQYAFKSGMKVDAVLKTDAGLLCIDSKFPMENFTLLHNGETESIRNSAKKDFISDVRKHINDISKKYILPEEGTMDFALMYIPSESVYYDIANMDELMEYSRKERVYPVSPNTLYAHLQVLLLSYQGKEMEQKSRELFRLFRAIQKDYEKINDQMGVLGKHVGNAYNSFSTIQGAFTVLGQKLSHTKDLPTEISDVKEEKV